MKLSPTFVPLLHLTLECALLGCFTHHFDLYALFYYLCNVVIELQYRLHR